MTVTLMDLSRRPFGLLTWEVGNYSCNMGQTIRLKLQLSACYQDQFTCNDGTCIPHDYRCDNKQDCGDISDEKQCKIVSLDAEKYLKDKTPPPLEEGTKLPAVLSMDIFNILDIREVESIISLKFELEAKWFDSRLDYFNLKIDSKINTLIFAESQMIWVPSILFFNTKQHLTSINDEKTFVSIARKKNGSLIGPTVNEDIMVYKGAENEIQLKRVYEIDFICVYNMRFYPFDIQYCTVDMVMAGSAAKFIDLLPGNLLYSGRKDLSQYYVMDFQIKTANIKNKDGVKVSIKLGRKLLGDILTVYVPTILLNTIGHSTNYFKSFFFEAVVSVNLTCMLVLVTMFISVSESLPKTSYIKMVDYWLIFTLLLPFFEVLLHTYMESLNEDEDTNKKNSDDETSSLQKSTITHVAPTSDTNIIKEDDPVSILVKKEAELVRKQQIQSFGKRIALVYIPIVVVVFTTSYWFIGLRNAELI